MKDVAIFGVELIAILLCIFILVFTLHVTAKTSKEPLEFGRAMMAAYFWLLFLIAGVLAVAVFGFAHAG